MIDMMVARGNGVTDAAHERREHAGRSKGHLAALRDTHRRNCIGWRHTHTHTNTHVVVELPKKAARKELDQATEGDRSSKVEL
eukprot:2752044-Amphidinium_carterae.1